MRITVDVDNGMADSYLHCTLACYAYWLAKQDDIFEPTHFVSEEKIRLQSAVAFDILILLL